jgi:DNA replication protein DnaC
MIENDEYACTGDYDKCKCPSCQSNRERENAIIAKQKENPEKILAYWGVSSKQLKSSFDNFNGGESAKKLCSEASKHLKSVLLCGKTGCGKTHLAVAMMRQKIINSETIFDVDHYYGRKQAIFITAPELLLEIRTSYNNKDGDTEEDIINKYGGIGLLVLDDLGAEKTSEWVESTLYLIIDRRNRNERWTIITSNLDLEEIEHHLGARIASRLSDMKVINIKLPDYRKKR